MLLHMSLLWVHTAAPKIGYVGLRKKVSKCLDRTCGKAQVPKGGPIEQVGHGVRQLP